jgi:NAD(P)-dependent dehydrogenase (short-subunit alcohol dehydrogenase family)
MGVRINAVAPGLTRGDYAEASLTEDPSTKEWIHSSTALGRMGEPEDIARSVMLMQYTMAPDKHYLDWARTVNRVSPLSYLKRMLQYLQWQGGGRRNRPWVLKNPGHTVQPWVTTSNMSGPRRRDGK